jgi:hypothetical protein
MPGCAWMATPKLTDICQIVLAMELALLAF